MYEIENITTRPHIDIKMYSDERSFKHNVFIITYAYIYYYLFILRLECNCYIHNIRTIIPE